VLVENRWCSRLGHSNLNSSSNLDSNLNSNLNSNLDSNLDSNLNFPRGPRRFEGDPTREAKARRGGSGGGSIAERRGATIETSWFVSDVPYRTVSYCMYVCMYRYMDRTMDGWLVGCFFSFVGCFVSFLSLFCFARRWDSDYDYVIFMIITSYYCLR